jgi:hypothetical protein
MTPSTAWKEVVAENEATLFESLATQLRDLQQARGASAGGLRRALHAKPNVVTHATFEVLSGLPAHAAVGLFATPKTYQAVVRFSNGTGGVQPDRRPDVRGVAVKVLGVGGIKLIPGMEQAPTQDFLAILTPAVPFHTPEEFVWVVVNSASPLSFLPKALVRLGPGRALKVLGALQKNLGKPVPSLAINRYFSALPIRFGDYAAKYSFVPMGATASGETPDDLGAELAGRVAKGPLTWELQVQFFTDERTTPIEDPTVDWPTPYTPVARLTVAKQDVQSERGQKLASWAEHLSFDPWHAQQEFRPIGAMMRSRSAAYRVSTQARSVAPEPAAIPPELVTP